jgi:hypothetical protein
MNAAVVQAQSDSRQATQPGSWRLSNRLRKAVLLFHIVAGGTWFGLDVAMAALVVTAIGTDSAAVRMHPAVAEADHGLASRGGASAAAPRQPREVEVSVPTDEFLGRRSSVLRVASVDEKE